MKDQNSVGVMYVFDLQCGKCNKWFRAESELEEPPRHTYCRHCNHSMYDDDDTTFIDSKYIGKLEIDLFTFKVLNVDLK